MKLQEILNNPQLFSIEEIKKGWSSDKKYYIQTTTSQEYLLRTAAVESFEHKKREFEQMEKASALGIAMSQPLDFTRDEELVYSLFTWCEGEQAEIVLPQLSEEDQYRLGVKSGEILKKIHSIPAPKETEKWESYFDRKIERNIKNYQACELSYENGERIVQFVINNRYLIKDRQPSFQHGDYHTGNMILSSTNELAIIDFNRFDYGDPWEEFNRIVFSAEVSPLFATGQVDGYFSGRPPLEFFRLMALYICTNTLNTLPWAMNFSEEDITKMMNQAKKILEWYNGMQRIIPSWYQENAGGKYVKK